MGIDAAFAVKLIEALPRVTGKSTGLMLGRQRLRVQPGGRRVFRRALRHAGLPPDYTEYQQDDGYAETFLHKIGYPVMQSLDYSDFEGADYTHDLNKPIPAKLAGRFDVIIDGGTVEHVYDTPAALDNIYAMLAPGGVFISINGMTGWPGHGFYQFSPELAWRYWQDVRQCNVARCEALSIDPNTAPVVVTDTGRGGSRFRGANLTGRWYLYYVAVKPETPAAAKAGGAALQGDYQVRWQGVGATTGTPESAEPVNLTELADKFGSDKGSKKHRYTELYHMLFQPFVARPINFMEMGLLIGGPEHGKSADRPTRDLPSIRMWLEYFQQAQIIGLDVSDFSWFAHERFRFFRCDMDERANIAKVAAELPEMDIILDDASHASHHQQAAFLELFPKLRSGGMYLIEDLIWQPPPYERKGITKTAPLFQSFINERAFGHSDPNVEKEFNALSSEISGCFMFQKHFQKHRRDQVVVVHKR